VHRRGIVVRARPDDVHAALEQLRQTVLDLRALELRASGQGDAKRQVLILAQLRATGPQPRIGRAALVGDPLAGVRVDDDPAPIARAPARADGDGVHPLAEHRLDGVAPDREDAH
jgi:hypothetical protein